jgi:NitT/TauT family transport system substrate-binding protein
MKKLAITLLCAMLLLTACGPLGAQTVQTPIRIRLPLGYIPNVQFAPLYVALERGFFTEAGIEVEFDYSFETDATALVGADELQFAVVSGEQVLLARAQELPVVYVAAWYQQYPVSVVSAAGLNIQAPADLRGKTIGLPGLYGANYIGLRALLHAGGLGETDVTLDSIGYTQVESFAGGRDQVVSVYTANEPIQLRSLGYDIHELRVADYLQMASNGLITNEKTIAEEPELVRSMVSVLLQGIQYTLDHPVEAYASCGAYVQDLDMSPTSIQRKVLATSMELWRADRLGASDPAAWVNMQTVLLDMGLLSTPLDLGAAYTNSFLP